MYNKMYNTFNKLVIINIEYNTIASWHHGVNLRIPLKHSVHHRNVVSRGLRDP